MAKSTFQLCSRLNTARKPGKFGEFIHNLFIIACCLLGAVVLSEVFYSYHVAPQNLILIYVLAILLLSVLTSSYFYSIAGTLAGVFLYDYLIAAPRFGFSFTLGFPITLVIMLIVSLFACTLVTKIKVIAIEALKANRKTETIYRLIRNFIPADDQQSLMQIAGEDVTSHIHRDVFFCLGDPASQDTKTALIQAGGTSVGTATLSDEQHQAALKACRSFCNGEAVERLPGFSCWRLSAGGELLGVMCVAHGGTPLQPDEEDFLQMIAVQMSIFLEKLNIAQERQKAEIQVKTEQARSSLLRGISHDLRNPLTSILGAASILTDNAQGSGIDPATRELLMGIRTDTEWLLRMVENILTITRLQSENMQVTKKLEAPEELIAYAVNTVRKRYPALQIHIEAPEELVLVPLDPILITQVLINLLENAAKHSPPHSRIVVTLSIEEKNIRISVADQGPGIFSLEERNLFEIDPRQGGITEDASRGMGMGLSICKTIVTVHGGKIGARNLPEGGALFWFTLPISCR